MIPWAAPVAGVTPLAAATSESAQLRALVDSNCPSANGNQCRTSSLMACVVLAIPFAPYFAFYARFLRLSEHSASGTSPPRRPRRLRGKACPLQLAKEWLSPSSSLPPFPLPGSRSMRCLFSCCRRCCLDDTLNRKRKRLRCTGSAGNRERERESEEGPNVERDGKGT